MFPGENQQTGNHATVGGNIARLLYKSLAGSEIALCFA
jgi:hypothetical protein